MSNKQNDIILENLQELGLKKEDIEKLAEGVIADVGADGQKEWLEPINEKMDRHGDNGVWTPEDIQESEDLLTQKD